MLTRRLPKTLRTVFFALGITMITVASAIEEIETWNAAHAAELAKCPAEAVAQGVGAVILGLLRG